MGEGEDGVREGGHFKPGFYTIVILLKLMQNNIECKL